MLDCNIGKNKFTNILSDNMSSGGALTIQLYMQYRQRENNKQRGSEYNMEEDNDFDTNFEEDIDYDDILNGNCHKICKIGGCMAL